MNICLSQALSFSISSVIKQSLFCGLNDEMGERETATENTNTQKKLEH